MITGKTRTGQKLETRVSQSLLAALETAKEWASTQAEGTLTPLPNPHQMRLENPQSQGACRDEVEPFHSRAFNYFPWRTQLFLPHTVHFWDVGESWGIPCPQGRHQTTVVFRPAALRCPHTP